MLMDESSEALQALLDHIDELPARVGADWSRVRPKLLGYVEAWLRGDEDPLTLASQMLQTLARYPEALALVLASIKSVQSSLESLRAPIAYAIPFPRGLDHPRPAVRAAPPAERSVDSMLGELRGALVDPSSPHLNAWFSDREANAPLVVKRPAKLCVNLGPKRGEAASAAIADVSMLSSVDHVDVVVQCATARISPPSQRLELPPSAERVVEFEFTPLKPGPQWIFVVLLVRNDPVERLRFEVDAREERAP